eukprot:CAMPEP_0179079286 /NCGR_PEP_ID=MMETSP0796-20121207/35564_1 /TAXON_ID=73915 /ORGANISM="Pyrodinium bahamense, Strain pbaha01" /LENGTH=423 /DNA_ID=CAMNT_0020776617 /DNA_START=14 /DNA_END=1286 /DNA_ORIENTATION=+
MPPTASSPWFKAAAVATQLLLLLGRQSEASFSFVTLGDWGGAALGGYHESNEEEVAKQLGKTAQEVGAQFVINTGDNFYYCGTQDISDKQFKEDFEDVYTAKSLSVPWYGVLGNHDYGYKADSQLVYKSPNNDRWQIPARYRAMRLLLGGSQYATFVFLDTSPCVRAYRADDPRGWDPCSGEFGDECKVGGKCGFHDHILGQNCSAQLHWLKSVLAAVGKDDWLIAVGHHPADQIDVEDFTSVLLAAGVRLYLNGHTHALVHYKLDGNQEVDFVTSGAGCMVHTHDQDLDDWEVNGHSRTEVAYKRVSGFTVHAFSEDFSELTTRFIDSAGNAIHTFSTSKAGPAPAPPPSGDASCVIMVVVDTAGSTSASATSTASSTGIVAATMTKCAVDPALLFDLNARHGACREEVMISLAAAALTRAS